MSSVNEKVSPQLNTHLIWQLIPLKTLYLHACTDALPQFPHGCTFGSTSNTSYPKNFLCHKDSKDFRTESKPIWMTQHNKSH